MTQLASKLLETTRSCCVDASPGFGAVPEMNVLTSNLMGMSVSGRSVSTIGEAERVREEVPTSVIKDQHSLTVRGVYPYTSNYPY